VFVGSAFSVDDKEINITGNYVNRDYGYSVQLKNGLSGSNLAPPAPQHGFGITLKPGSAGYVWVTADYDALFAGSVERAAEQESRSFAEQEDLHVIEDKPATLADLPAREVVLSNPAGRKRINYVRLWVAYRKVPGEVGIIYVIGLEQGTRSAAGEAIFSSIAGTFKTVPIGH
jgi:hypothetical protein